VPIHNALGQTVLKEQWNSLDIKNLRVNQDMKEAQCYRFGIPLDQSSNRQKFKTH
jgi:hypothetical protein